MRVRFLVFASAGSSFDHRRKGVTNVLKMDVASPNRPTIPPFLLVDWNFANSLFLDTPAMEFLSSLSPSAIDFEFRSLSGMNDCYDLKLVFYFLKDSLIKRTNFELTQAYLNIFLKVREIPLIPPCPTSSPRVWTKLPSLEWLGFQLECSNHPLFSSSGLPLQFHLANDPLAPDMTTRPVGHFIVIKY